MKHKLLVVLALLSATACSKEPDPRGVDRRETLLQVSAIGQADTRPDEARFTVGVSTIEGSADAASASNNRGIEQVVKAVQAVGVKADDIQTRNISLSKIDYGKDRGRYRAENMIEVRVRDVKKVSAAIGAATQAGANVLSGPDMRVSDQESANRSAYAQAYKAARARADAYASAAGLKVARVLAIRETGTQGGEMPFYPPPVGNRMAAEQAATAPMMMTGMNVSQVRIQVDFALAE